MTDAGSRQVFERNDKYMNTFSPALASLTTWQILPDDTNSQSPGWPQFQQAIDAVPAAKLRRQDRSRWRQQLRAVSSPCSTTPPSPTLAPAAGFTRWTTPRSVTSEMGQHTPATYSSTGTVLWQKAKTAHLRTRQGQVVPAEAGIDHQPAVHWTHVSHGRGPST